MRIHLVRNRPLMTRLEFIAMAAGPSVALVAVFIRLTGIGQMSNLLIFYLGATAPVVLLGLALSWFAIREEINRALTD